MLSVVVPAYRAAAFIRTTLDELTASLDALQRPYEIIVVSDGNTDGTDVEARRHPGPLTVLHYEGRRGKGYALRWGIAHAKGDHIAFIDADLDLHPDGIGELLSLVEAGADAAIGSKRHARSQVQYPTLRRLQSVVYQLLIRILFDLRVTDTQTGLKVFRGDLLRTAAPMLESDGFAMDLELLVELRRRGATVVEGPVRLDYGFTTTTSLKAVGAVLRDTAQIYRRHRRRLRAHTRRGRHAHVPHAVETPSSAAVRHINAEPR